MLRNNVLHNISAFFSQRSPKHVQYPLILSGVSTKLRRERLHQRKSSLLLWQKAWSYSVEDFLSVDVASHQHREGVPVLNRHGAEGLQDIYVLLFLGHWGVAVMQID